jgi:uncharacterized membrane protein YfcA
MFDSVLITLVFLLAGFSKGLIGLGLPTIAMALLSLLAGPVEAAALLLLPSFVTNLVQIAPAREAWRLAHRLWPMLLGVVMGTALGGFLWGGFGGRYGALVLGLALAAYGALALAAWRPSWPERWGGLVGTATGALTAATGVFVIPAVPWLQGIGLAREELVRALGLAFLVSTLALGALLGGAGALEGRMLGASALALLPALAGQALGARLRGRLSEAMFKGVFFAGLLVLGCAIALRG